MPGSCGSTGAETVDACLPVSATTPNPDATSTESGDRDHRRAARSAWPHHELVAAIEGGQRVLGRREPGARIGRDHLVEERAQRCRHVDGHRALRELPWLLPRQQVQQRRAEREQIGGGVDEPASCSIGM